MKRLHLALAAAALLSAGCMRVGPKSVVRDSFDYHKAVSQSREEQMLLNVVKLRYLEAPMFLEVGQIVAGYNLEGALTGSAGFVSGGSDSFGVAGGGKYTERPTITYSPVSGGRFLELLLTPIPPGSILFLIGAGYSAEVLMRLAVESVNGLHNRRIRARGGTLGDRRFYEMCALMEELQMQQQLGMRVDEDEEGELSTVIFFRPGDLSEELGQKITKLKTQLGLRADLSQFEVRYSPPTLEANRLDVISRSMLQVMMALAAGVEVPEKDAEEGRAVAMEVSDDPGDQPLLRVQCTDERPEDAYVAVRYRDHWFSIDDRDLESKRVFAFVLILFNITESGSPGIPPLVTIPAG